MLNPVPDPVASDQSSGFRVRVFWGKYPGVFGVRIYGSTEFAARSALSTAEALADTSAREAVGRDFETHGESSLRRKERAGNFKANSAILLVDTGNASNPIGSQAFRGAHRAEIPTGFKRAWACLRSLRLISA
jgi:hypothetical protein